MCQLFCHKYDKSNQALVSNTEDSVSSVTLLLQVAAQLLWHSAYMSLIGTCGVEASRRLSAPEATKELTIVQSFNLIG